jgi:hypothetical protein
MGNQQKPIKPVPPSPVPGTPQRKSKNPLGTKLKPATKSIPGRIIGV